MTLRITQTEIETVDDTNNKQVYFAVEFQAQQYEVMIQLPDSGDSQHEVLQKNTLMYKQNIDEINEFYNLMIEICKQNIEI